MCARTERVQSSPTLVETIHRERWLVKPMELRDQPGKTVFDGERMRV
jgi:hypothetical protein